MFKEYSLKFLLFPMILFVGFAGLFCVLEFRSFGYDKEMHRVLNDPVINRIFDFQEAIWAVETAVNEASPSSEKQASVSSIDDKVRELKRSQSDLMAYFLKDPLQTDAYVKEIDGLKAISHSLDQIDLLLGEQEKLSSADWEKVERILSNVVYIYHELSASVVKEKRDFAAEVHEKIKQGERQRALLAILVLLAGFGLVLALLDVIFHYKANAERAKAAEKCNALFAAALQNTRVGVLIRDMRLKDHPVVFTNAAFTGLTGYDFEEVKSNSSEFLFGWNTDQASIRTFHRAVQLGEAITLEAMLYRKDGSPFWAEWYLTPLMGDDGRLAYFVSLFSDITNVRSTQEELIQAKLFAEHASAIKTNFLAIMSHEIRTPINGILGVLKLMRDTKLDEEQKHLLGIATTSSSALHGIINDILDYAKMEAGRVEIYAEPFPLRTLINDIIQLASSLLGDKKLELITDIPADLPDYFMGDAGRLRQILLNLVSNAIKFTDTGSVCVRVIPLMQEEVNGLPGFLMRFEVVDTGLGISTADQTKLFQEFSQVERTFTRRYGGTGLGLAICRRLVLLMQGEIGVESQLGHGSKFWFMLPMQLSDELVIQDEKDPLVDRSSVQDEHKYNILLVEDNDTNRFVARCYLEKAGLLVEEACDGVEAIDKAKERAYDVILMDVSMPKMDGMMATCQIRALGGHNAHVPIIALTAHAMEGDRQLCLAAGMNDYLHKPLDFKDLVRSLERWLHTKLKNAQPAVTPPLAEQPKRNLWEEQVPIFDPSVLKSIKDDLGGAAVMQITEVFLADSSKRIAAFTSGQLSLIREASHTLKSCSASCGLKKFSHLMASLEEAAAVQNTPRVSELLPFVQDIYATSRAKLEAERPNFSM